MVEKMRHIEAEEKEVKGGGGENLFTPPKKKWRMNRKNAPEKRERNKMFGDE